VCNNFPFCFICNSARSSSTTHSFAAKLCQFRVQGNKFGKTFDLMINMMKQNVGRPVSGLGAVLAGAAAGASALVCLKVRCQQLCRPSAPQKTFRVI
jgi:hypothetical protein